MNRALYKTIMLILFGGLVACGSDDGEKTCNGSGGPNKLEGSYCSNVEMSFTEVQIRLQENEALRFLFVEYVTPFDMGLEKTLSIAFDTNLIQVQAGQPVDFLTANAIVKRVLPGGTQILTDQLQATSSITFDTYDNGNVGTNTSGQFNFLFDSGRVLSGEFEGTVANANPTDS